MLQKDVEDHVKGKKTDEFAWRKVTDIRGKIGVSSGGHQEKKLQYCAHDTKNQALGKDYDQVKDGKQKRKRKAKKATGRRFETMEWMEDGRIGKSSE